MMTSLFDDTEIIFDDLDGMTDIGDGLTIINNSGSRSYRFNGRWFYTIDDICKHANISDESKLILKLKYG